MSLSEMVKNAPDTVHNWVANALKKAPPRIAEDATAAAKKTEEGLVREWARDCAGYIVRPLRHSLSFPY